MFYRGVTSSWMDCRGEWWQYIYDAGPVYTCGALFVEELKHDCPCAMVGEKEW